MVYCTYIQFSLPTFATSDFFTTEGERLGSLFIRKSLLGGVTAFLISLKLFKS